MGRPCKISDIVIENLAEQVAGSKSAADLRAAKQMLPEQHDGCKGHENITRAHKIKGRESYLWGFIYGLSSQAYVSWKRILSDWEAAEVLEYNQFANYKPRLKHDQAAAPRSSGLHPEAGEESA